MHQKVALHSLNGAIWSIMMHPKYGFSMFFEWRQDPRFSNFDPTMGPTASRTGGTNEGAREIHGRAGQRWG